MSQSTPLKRQLSLTQMILYGVGTTVGAGIYALIGEISAVAGQLAPWSFLVAALFAGFTAYSFARLSARYPRAAGSALYVEKGLGLPMLAKLVGLFVVAAGVTSSAALMNGFVGYLGEFVELPRTLIIVMAAGVLCLIAIWGIGESVWLAGIISVIEVLGLVWIIVLSGMHTDFSQLDTNAYIPDFSLGTWSVILVGAVLSFYAYIGFEDMVEVAEEVKDVSKTLPRAILATLIISSVLYVLLVTTTLFAVGPDVLSRSSAPLADVYRAITGNSPVVISFIGLFAIINGALIQIIMASRVLYGLASRAQLTAWLAWVHPKRQTPIPATLVAASLVLALALAGSLAGLAELTSVVMLVVFALVNWSLCRLSWQDAKVRALTSFVGGSICITLAGHTALTWVIAA